MIMLVVIFYFVFFFLSFNMAVICAWSIKDLESDYQIHITFKSEDRFPELCHIKVQSTLVSFSSLSLEGRGQP